VVEVTVALIAGAVSLISLAISLWANHRAGEIGYQREQELKALERRLDEEKEIRSTARAKVEETKTLVDKYREPLARSAFDFQSRIWNIIRQSFLHIFYGDGTKRSSQYALDNTMFVIAQYLGWVELIRRDLQWLDLGEKEMNRELQNRLDYIAHVFATDDAKLVGPASAQSERFRIFHGEQRAIGEALIAPASGGERPECLGYGAFVEALTNDHRLLRWFDPLAEDIRAWASGDASAQGRLRELQHGVIKLLDLFDPLCERFPQKARTLA
jgi:hypothetical protein